MKIRGFFWRLKLSCQRRLAPISLIPTAGRTKGVTAEFTTDFFIFYMSLMLTQDGFHLKIITLERRWGTPVCLWSLPSVPAVAFPAGARGSAAPNACAGRAAHPASRGTASPSVGVSPPFLGSSCENNPQRTLMDNELGPTLAALGSWGGGGGGGGWERRRLGACGAGFLGADLSHPFHTEKHVSARGGEKRCLAVPGPSAPIGCPGFA